MPQLLYMPEVGISGMTGILKIDQNNIIYRKLMWGTFENGLAIVLNQKNQSQNFNKYTINHLIINTLYL